MAKFSGRSPSKLDLLRQVLGPSHNRFHRNKGPRWSHWFRDNRIAYLTSKAILEHVGISRNFRWSWNFLIFPAVLLHFKYQFCCASVRIPFEISGTRLSSSSCSERYLRAPVSGRKAVRMDWGWGWVDISYGFGNEVVNQLIVNEDPTWFNHQPLRLKHEKKEELDR